jgi:hypothetical protein
MKKNLVIILSFSTILLTGCFNSNNQITKIEWENIALAEQTFNNQIEETPYITDFEDFLSYNILSITEDKPFTSDLYLNAKFDETSSVQWWVQYSQKKFSKSHNTENYDIDFNVKAEKPWENPEPFDLSWSVSLLYKDNEMYANLHDLNVFMWEWNMVAKMYTLLWDLLIDNRVNLDVHSWWIITIDEKENTKLPYIIWTFKNILKTENIESNPNFLWSVVETLDTIGSYIDLWISTNELKITNYEISYFELWNKTIQKQFTWSFQWKDSIFDLSFIASKKWLEFHIYNIKEYDEDIADYKDADLEFLLSIQEKNDSEYSILFDALKAHQKVANLQWIIKYTNSLEISGDFNFEPLELIEWQKISWKLEWNITKKSWESDKEIPELTGDIASINELLSSL